MSWVEYLLRLGAAMNVANVYCPLVIYGQTGPETFQPIKLKTRYEAPRNPLPH